MPQPTTITNLDITLQNSTALDGFKIKPLKDATRGTRKDVIMVDKDGLVNSTFDITTFLQALNQRIEKIIPITPNVNYVITPATQAPDEVNADGRAIYKKIYNNNFTGLIALTPLESDEAYLLQVTTHYRVTGVMPPGFVRVRSDFRGGGFNPINNVADSQDSIDLLPTNNIELNSDKTFSRYYYGETNLSYFQHEINIHIPNSIRTTYPEITIERQKLEIIVYIIKKSLYISTPIIIY